MIDLVGKRARANRARRVAIRSGVATGGNAAANATAYANARREIERLTAYAYNLPADWQARFFAAWHDTRPIDSHAPGSAARARAILAAWGCQV